MNTNAFEINRLYRIFFPADVIPRNKPIITMRNKLYDHGIVSSKAGKIVVLKSNPLPIFEEIDSIIFNVLLHIPFYYFFPYGGASIKTVCKLWNKVTSTDYFYQEVTRRELSYDLQLGSDQYKKVWKFINSRSYDDWEQRFEHIILNDWFDLYKYDLAKFKEQLSLNSQRDREYKPFKDIYHIFLKTIVLANDIKYFNAMVVSYNETIDSIFKENVWDKKSREWTWNEKTQSAIIRYILQTYQKTPRVYPVSVSTLLMFENHNNGTEVFPGVGEIRISYPDILNYAGQYDDSYFELFEFLCQHRKDKITLGNIEHVKFTSDRLECFMNNFKLTNEHYLKIFKQSYSVKNPQLCRILPLIDKSTLQRTDGNVLINEIIKRDNLALLECAINCGLLYLYPQNWTYNGQSLEFVKTLDNHGCYAVFLHWYCTDIEVLRYFASKLDLKVDYDLLKESLRIIINSDDLHLYNLYLDRKPRMIYKHDLKHSIRCNKTKILEAALSAILNKKANHKNRLKVAEYQKCDPTYEHLPLFIKYKYFSIDETKTLFYSLMSNEKYTIAKLVAPNLILNDTEKELFASFLTPKS